MKYIAFFGNSSTGKTTALLKCVYELKSRGLSVTCITDVIRRNMQVPSLLDVHIGWNQSMFFKQLSAEAEAMTKDADFILAERCPLDYFCYLQYRQSDMLKEFYELAMEWVKQYKAIIYFDDTTKYIYDGFRPVNDSIRVEVSKSYREIQKELLRRAFNIHTVSEKGFRERAEKVWEIVRII